MEQPADQRLDPRQRPPLVRPPVSQRASLQLPPQPGDLGFAESRSSRRSLRQDSSFSALAPGPAPPLDRPHTDPQGIGNLRVPLPAIKTLHSLEPQPLPRGPLGVGQPAALRVPHTPGLLVPAPNCQANGPDITHSSSVVVQVTVEVLKGLIRIVGASRSRAGPQIDYARREKTAAAFGCSCAALRIVQAVGPATRPGGERETLLGVDQSLGTEERIPIVTESSATVRGVTSVSCGTCRGGRIGGVDT